MSNLESSWEETVVKLAQAGNLRAMAFWLNRYLVAQGICVQATTHQPGQLTLQILCRQVPDRDRLIRFICHRLCQLNSPVIRSVQLNAQMVGSAQLLWSQTAQLAPVSNSPAAEPIGGKTELAAQENDSSVAIAEVALVDRATNPALEQAIAVAEKLIGAPIPPAGIPASIAFQPQPSQNRSRKAGRSLKPQSLKPQSLKRKTAHWLKHSQQQVQRSGHSLKQSTERSIQWFQRQKPRRKVLILGSSAVAAFLLGCGSELMRHQITLLTAKSQNPEAASGANYAGMVKTAIEQVPVVQFPAANPDDSTITLLFSNAVTLASAATGSQSGIATQQNADMLMTSLNTPLADLAGTAASPGTAVSPSPSPSGATVDPASDRPETDTVDTAETDTAVEQPPIDLPPLTLQQLQANRVSVVNLASNQMMQSGSNGLTQTIKSLSQLSIYPIGAGANQQSARRPQIFSIKGKRIAYLGYADVGSQVAGQNTAGLNASVSAQVEADIKSIRNQVDWVIVSYHWNQNLRAYPEDWQINLTHAAIDHGADLVVGYHPTVTQGAEVYGGRAIVYSLGSMLDPSQAEDTDAANQQYETLALKLSLQDQQMQLDLLPVRVSGGQTEFLSAETGASILDYLKQASSLFRQPLRSPTMLDAKIRLTLPAAPNSDKPFSAPFTRDPVQDRP